MLILSHLVLNFLINDELSKKADNSVCIFYMYLYVSI